MSHGTSDRPELSLAPLWELLPGRIILVEFEGLCGRYPCTLVKTTLEGELMVQVPRSVTLRHPLRPDDTVVVRFALDGALYGFRTRILRHTLRPQPVMVLARPANIGMRCLRQDDRVPCLIPATATVAGHCLTGMIIDLSHGGCRFACETGAEPAPIPVNAEISLRFPLFQIDEQQIAIGTVCSATPGDGTLRIGIEFGAQTASVTASIEAYIAGLIEIVDQEAA